MAMAAVQERYRTLTHSESAPDVTVSLNISSNHAVDDTRMKARTLVQHKRPLGLSEVRVPPRSETRGRPLFRSRA